MRAAIVQSAQWLGYRHSQQETGVQFPV